MADTTREQAQDLFRDLVSDADFSLESTQVCYVSPKRFVEVISAALDALVREARLEEAKQWNAAEELPIISKRVWRRRRLAQLKAEGQREEERNASKND
jgi:hypothetical protein